MHPYLHTDLDNLDSTQHNLRHSAKGSLDVITSLTSYEPNDTVSNEFVNSQGSFSYVTPSSDLDIDDTTLGKLLAEVHRGQADYRSPEGVSVSQSSVSVVFDRTGKAVGESNVDRQLVLVSRETRTVLTASFLKTPKLRKMPTTPQYLLLTASVVPVFPTESHDAN